MTRRAERERAREAGSCLGALMPDGVNRAHVASLDFTPADMARRRDSWIWLAPFAARLARVLLSRAEAYTMTTHTWLRGGVGCAALGIVIAGFPRPVAAAEGGSERTWQASVQGRWFPGLGEAKGSVAESGAPDGGAGYGLRLERRLSDWWSVGVGLSTSAWRVAPAGETGVLESGSFVDMVLSLKLEPLRFEIPGGPLSMYVTGSAGPTLSGDTRFVSIPGRDAERGFETVRFDAGYAAGGSAGFAYRPAPRLSIFLEAGLDWHYAVHGRRRVDLGAFAAAEPLSPVFMERLWVGQGVVAAGAAFHF